MEDAGIQNVRAFAKSIEDTPTNHPEEGVSKVEEVVHDRGLPVACFGPVPTSAPSKVASNPFISKFPHVEGASYQFCQASPLPPSPKPCPVPKSDPSKVATDPFISKFPHVEGASYQFCQASPLPPSPKPCPVPKSDPSKVATDPFISKFPHVEGASYQFCEASPLPPSPKPCPLPKIDTSSLAIPPLRCYHASLTPRVNAPASPIVPARLIDSNAPRCNNMRACLLDYWIENRGYNPDVHDGHDPLPFVNGLPADLNREDRDFQRWLDKLMASGSYKPDTDLQADLEAMGYTF